MSKEVKVILTDFENPFSELWVWSKSCPIWYAPR